MWLINKFLSLTWVGDLAERLNGNKTLVSAVGLLLSAGTILIPQYFPELSGVASILLKIQELLLGLGVDIQTLAGLSTAGIVWGGVHKVTKKLEKSE